MRLINPTDCELNRAFAEKVAGWYVKEEFPGTDFPFTAWQGDGHLSDHRWAHANGPMEHITPFIDSACAVLPYLNKQEEGWQSSTNASGTIVVIYGLGHLTWNSGNQSTLPRAAVIALLRAHGVEIESTK